MTKRILITGGTGFVGYWISQTAPDNVTPYTIGKSHLIDGMGKDWERVNWDAIIHLAPISPAYVLSYAQSHHIRVLFASSGAVYEKQDDYAYYKRLWEDQCVHSGVDCVIARLFCFTGAHLPRKMWDGSTPAILKFIQDGIAGGPVHYYDNGYIRSYMYGEDLGRWLWKLLLDGEGVYDVGASDPVQMSDVAKMVASVCGCDVVEDLPPESKPISYLPNVIRALDLGCKETISLRLGIERTVEDERIRISGK